MRKIFTVLTLLQFVFLFALKAQNNQPIQVSPNLMPPYSLNLSDYCSFGSQQLMVTVNVPDLNVSNLPVKLHIKMECAGVSIETPLTINTTPIYLDGGATSILFGKDLIDYFDIDKLIFQGYSKEAYTRTGQLPEGYYKFTVEVLHFNTNRVISNSGTASAWIALGKPPELTLPLDEAEQGEFNGMPITFSWLASNVGSPVSAANIQYKFEMWEMRIDGISPYTVAASMPVMHEYTSFVTQYSLYPSTLLMEPGMEYAWRVTASDFSGFVSFEQDGQSEIRTFTYKQNCDTVSNFESSYRAKNGSFNWTAAENHTSFNTEIRNPVTLWSESNQTYDSKVEYFDLDYGTSYEMRVQAVCNGDPESVSDYTEWQSLSIPVPESLTDTSCPECTCDDEIAEVELTNFTLRDDLKAGDTLSNKTETTRFILETVEQQGDGTYKGIFLFWSEIWNLKFICEYWDLQVNSDNIIVNYDFESVYDPQFLLDVEAAEAYINNLANGLNDLLDDAEIKDTLSFNDEITSIYVNAGDSVMAVTVDENGDVHEVLIDDDVDDLSKTLVVGENGEEYVITSGGDVMGLDAYENTGGSQSNIDEYNEEKEAEDLSESTSVEFFSASGQQYGFDAYTEEKSALVGTYPTLQNGYRPAYKSVASYSTDIVGASDLSQDISYKDEMGIPALVTGENLTVRGASDGSELALYAYQTLADSSEEIVGKLNILSYDKQNKKVYIISVNGAELPGSEELQSTLNSTYGQAVTSWQVATLQALENVVFENENMTHGGSSAFTTYNTDQKSIVSAFEVQTGSSLESEAYYLFFVENVDDKERNIGGYMPLQRQVGFIYDNPNVQTIAHELGHGAFNLSHTFSSDQYISEEHSTNNLMDYTGSTELWKHQWQEVQSPNKQLFAWTQDEEEGEAIIGTENPEFVKEVLVFLRDAYLNSAENKLLNIYELGAGVNCYGNIDIGDGIERFIRIKTGEDAWDNKNIILDLENMKEGANYRYEEQLIYYINEDRKDEEFALEIHCHKVDKERIIDYINGGEVSIKYKIESIVDGKLQYNFTLSRYEDIEGVEIEIQEFDKILKNDCYIIGGDYEYIKYDQDKITARNGVETTSILTRSLLDFVKESSKLYFPAQIAGATIDLKSIESGSSPLTMLPIFGLCIEPLEYFAGWADLEQDYDWIDAKLDYHKMVEFINNYGNIYNVGFIYTNKPIFKELEKNVFVISNEYSPTNKPIDFINDDAININYVYWGHLSTSGDMIIKGEIDFY